MNAKDLQTVVEKIMDYRPPAQAPTVQAGLSPELWIKLMAGLGGRVSRTSTVKAYYETLRRYSEDHIVNDVQERFLAHAASLFNGSMPSYVVNVVTMQTLERYMAAERNSQAVSRADKGSAGMAPPSYKPGLVYPPLMKEAAVRLIMDSARTIKYLRRFPVRPAGCTRMEHGPEAVRPRSYFLGDISGDCPLLMRHDNGSSVMTFVAEILEGAQGRDPQETHRMLDDGIAEAGRHMQDVLVDYYAQVSYPFEHYAKPLGGLSDRVRVFHQSCAALLVRLDENCGSAAGLVRTTPLARAIDAVGKSGVPPEFSDHVRYPPSPDETAGVCAMIDRLAAMAYALRLIGLGRLSFPDIDSGDISADAEAARVHEECSAAAHRTVNSLMSAVVDACEEGQDGGPYLRSCRARVVACNIYNSMVESVDAVLAALRRVQSEVMNPACHEVTRRGSQFPPMPLTATQTAAFSIIGPGEDPPALFNHMVLRATVLVASKLA